MSFSATYFIQGKKQSLFKKFLYFNLIKDNNQLEFDSNNRTFDVTSSIEAPSSLRILTVRKDAIKTVIISNWKGMLTWISSKCLCIWIKHSDESRNFLFLYILHLEVSGRTIHLTTQRSEFGIFEQEYFIANLFHFALLKCSKYFCNYISL